MTPNPDFKVTLSSDAECQKRYNIETSLQWNTARELHMPYSLVLTACCWVTLSELAKYSMTRSITRSICDSWASCYLLHVMQVIFADGSASVSMVMTWASLWWVVRFHLQWQHFLLSFSCKIINENAETTYTRMQLADQHVPCIVFVRVFWY